MRKSGGSKPKITYPNVEKINSERRAHSQSKPHQKISQYINRNSNTSNRKKTLKRNDMIPRTIAFYQSTCELLMPRLPFRRLVKKIMEDTTDRHYCWEHHAFEALQTAAQDYMTNLFQQSNWAAEHCKRVTLMSKDMALARRIRGFTDPGNR